MHLADQRSPSEQPFSVLKLLVVLALTGLCSGCSPNSSPPVMQDPSGNVDETYYPLTLGNTWYYLDNAGGASIHTVESVQNISQGREALVRIYSDGEVVNHYTARWQENRFQTTLDSIGVDWLLELELPLEIGQTWQKLNYSTDDRIVVIDSEVIAVDSELTLLDETYSVTLVRDIYQRDYIGLEIDTFYTAYAPDIGPVYWYKNGLETYLDRFEPGLE